MTFDAAELLAGALASLPFLPRGKGALILILGGLAMLAFSLFGAHFYLSSAPPSPTLSRPVRFRSDPPRASVLGAKRAARVAGSGAEWVAGLEGAVKRLRIGRGRILRGNSTQCAFFLAGCRSCRKRRKGEVGCEPERALIELSVRRLAPGARVAEVACGSASNGACTFQIERGG